MSFNVGDVLPAHYDPVVIAASYIVSVLGSYFALFHAQHMFRRDGSINRSIALSAAVSLGGIGIWAMHFIGMMGFRLPVTVVYEGFATFASLIAAIVIAGIGLVLAGGRGRFSVRGWTYGSVLAGAGVCVMHYLGMYAMNLRATMSLDLGVVAASVAIAVFAAAAALWLVFHIRQTSHRIAAALIMGVAVCAMHYTGMSSAQFICISQAPQPFWFIGGENLPALVFLVTCLVLVWLFWNAMGVKNEVETRHRDMRMVNKLKKVS
ncbi:MAG TPA: MHYT domain-containing protein [Ramlibacter sp.]|nr:MHYT domain-containing protein [Ramlibacter sp.]